MGDLGHDGLRLVLLQEKTGASASLLVNHGWQAGGPWLQEVGVPAEMPWEEADIAITHPRAQWAKWGVKARTGKLKVDKTQADGAEWTGFPRLSQGLSQVE